MPIVLIDYNTHWRTGAVLDTKLNKQVISKHVQQSTIKWYGTCNDKVHKEEEYKTMYNRCKANFDWCGGFFLVCEDLGRNVRQFIPSLRFFFFF